MKGYCNCGKKATSEWIIIETRGRKNSLKAAWSMKWCQKCAPKEESLTAYKIDGK